MRRLSWRRSIIKELIVELKGISPVAESKQKQQEVEGSVRKCVWNIVMGTLEKQKPYGDGVEKMGVVHAQGYTLGEIYPI